MNKKIILLLLNSLFLLPVYGQEGDVEVITDSDRSITLANRVFSRPQMIDTSISVDVINYPLLVLKESVSVDVAEINPANVRLRPQLAQLYNGYAKLGLGSRLQTLGEVYYNSVRSRRANWGIHGLHHGEWGRINDYAPSQYDHTKLKAFGKVEETRFSYGGDIGYTNQGLHYYGFENPDANRDSIKQRYQGIGFSGFFDSHKKDSAMLNYRIGVEYNNFLSRKPEEDSLKSWRARENYAALKTTWQYNGSTNLLLANLRADLNVMYNDYRYGIADTSLTALDTGIVSQNTVIELKPLTNFYGLNRKLQFKVGGVLTFDYHDKLRTSLYPVAEVRYSLFNDMFIPYAGVEGGLRQQRFEHLANTNEFISANQQLKNESRYQIYGGIKGTLSSKISFNASIAFANARNHALFVNDTIYSLGNQFRVEYDTLSITTIAASISYQENEKLKVDLIGRFNSYIAKNNPYAWNLPQLEIIARGSYNIASKLIANIDFTLETGRRARVFDPLVENVEVEDDFYFKKLGVLADANIGIEFRYTRRLSIFVNFNNIAAQGYKRWFDYPVNRFQAMAGLSFRF